MPIESAPHKSKKRCQTEKKCVRKPCLRWQASPPGNCVVGRNKIVHRSTHGSPLLRETAQLVKFSQSAAVLAAIVARIPKSRVTHRVSSEAQVYGRGGGVGRGRRVGRGLGVTLGVEVGLTLGEGLVVGEA